MEPYIDLIDHASTKESIILVAIHMFAARSYSAVTVRDIAEAVGITAASIYNHFDSKEAILQEIIDRTDQTIRDYYERIGILVEQATSFDEVMRCLFKELEEVNSMTVYYGVAVLASEEFHNAQASAALDDAYMQQGIDFIAKTFAYCVDKGWVKPFDVVTCATLVMNSVFTGSLIYVQQDLGHKVLYSPSEMFTSLRKYLTASLSGE